MKQSKRIEGYRKSHPDLSSKDFTLEEAVELIKDYHTKASTKFKESVDAQVFLGVDPVKGDQVVKSTVSLPHGTGRTVRVIVFAEGDDIKKALDAGAIEAGSDDLVDRVKNGFADFDKCIATPGIMKKLTPLGKVLGPRGIMPNPKLGTVTEAIPEAVQSFLGGKIDYRTGKDPIVRVSVGRADFAPEKLVDNIKELISSIKHAKPATIKGAYLLQVKLSTTMCGFSVKVPASFL